MATLFSEIRSIYSKYFDVDILDWNTVPDFRSLDQSNPDIARLTVLEQKVSDRGEVNPYLNALYKKFAGEKLLKEEESEVDSFEDLQASAEEKETASEYELPEDELGKNEETFANKYPNVDEKEVLAKSYVTWLDGMTTKPFFKTIAAFYDLAKVNQLNFIDRAFLWKFLKAISSCITHLLIEGEQREESICLVDTYFDSLNDCLLSTIHAKSKDDVIQSFMYMVSFLGLNRDVKGNVETLNTGDTTNKDEKESVGEF